jgi:predicted metal-dependent hydrolase
MEKRMIMYSEKEIWFDIEFKTVKNFNLSVKPDQSVYVSAPLNTPVDRIETFVRSKAPWIIKRLKEFDETKSIYNGEKEYVNGETFKYLGKQYRLKIEETTGKERVTIDSRYLLIHVKKKENKRRKQNLLNDWFRNRARRVFQSVLDEIYPLVEHEVPVKPSLEIKAMKKRWGSCLRAKHRVLLNYELIKAPKHCIEYVALHELIHFVHKNHNIEFYDKLTVLMPDWKERKAILDEKTVMFV